MSTSGGFTNRETWLERYQSQMRQLGIEESVIQDLSNASGVVDFTWDIVWAVRADLAFYFADK